MEYITGKYNTWCPLFSHLKNHNNIKIIKTKFSKILSFFVPRTLPHHLKNIDILTTDVKNNEDIKLYKI